MCLKVGGWTVTSSGRGKIRGPAPTRDRISQSWVPMECSGYQGVNYAEIKDHPERVSWEVKRPETAVGYSIGIALENDGRLRVHWTDGRATFVTNESDRLVDEEHVPWTSLEYDLQKATHVPIGPPKESDTVTATNDTDGPQEMTIAVAFTETQSTSWKHSAGLKIGVKSEFGAGIPAIASTKVEVSAEVSYGFEWNRVNTSSKTKTLSFPVKVPPKSAIMGQVTWQDNSITVPFKVKGTGKFASGVTVPISFYGVYEGTASSHLNGKWVPYEKGGGNQARAMLEESPGMPPEMLSDPSRS